MARKKTKAKKPKRVRRLNILEGVPEEAIKRAMENGLRRETFANRIAKGWDLEEAINRPPLRVLYKQRVEAEAKAAADAKRALLEADIKYRVREVTHRELIPVLLEHKVPPWVYRWRIRLGYSHNKALTTPYEPRLGTKEFTIFNAWLMTKGVITRSVYNRLKKEKLPLSLIFDLYEYGRPSRKFTDEELDRIKESPLGTHLVYERVRRGHTLEDALNMPRWKRCPKRASKVKVPTSVNLRFHLAKLGRVGDYDTIYRRLTKGWSFEDAVNLPIRVTKPRKQAEDAEYDT